MAHSLPTLASKYDVHEQIGKGGYAVVYLAVDKKTKEHVAVKVLDKAKLSPKGTDQVKDEVDILHKLDHPNLLKIIDTAEDDKSFYIITELCDGGELFDRIVEREFYAEKDAQQVLRALASALHYCHSKKIIHRDLKPENILLSTKGEDAVIKVADFGFAKQLEEEATSSTTLGTPQYLSPEVIERKPYDYAIDMWSYGVIAFILLSGYPPFHDENAVEMCKKIKTATFAFDAPYWDNISDAAKDLIKRCLTLDPKKRITAAEAMVHPFLTQEFTGTDITPAISELREFLSRRRQLRRSVWGALTTAKLRSLTDRLVHNHSRSTG